MIEVCSGPFGNGQAVASPSMSGVHSTAVVNQGCSPLRLLAMNGHGGTERETAIWHIAMPWDGSCRLHQERTNEHVSKSAPRLLWSAETSSRRSGTGGVILRTVSRPTSRWDLIYSGVSKIRAPSLWAALRLFLPLRWQMPFEPDVVGSGLAFSS